MIKNIKEIIDFNVDDEGIIHIKNKNTNSLNLVYRVNPLTISEINKEIEYHVKDIYKEFLAEINFELKIIIQNRKINLEKDSLSTREIKGLSDIYDKRIYIVASIDKSSVETVDNIVYKIKKIGLNVNRIINKDELNSVIYSMLHKQEVDKKINVGETDGLLPTYISTKNFRNIEMEGKYISSIMVNKYPERIGFCELFEALPTDIEYDITLFISRKDKNKILKDLTYKISSISSEIKTVNNNQIDIEILKKIGNDSQSLRKDIQVNDEEVFGVNLVFTFFSYNLVELNSMLNEFKSRLFPKGFLVNVANFRQEEVFLSTLPIKTLSDNLKKDATLMTTSSLANMFCLYNKTIFDLEGVLLGYIENENKICKIDIFDEKYLNANVCVLGSSGSGKSFFLKLLLFRMRSSIKKYIFDNEGEYLNLTCGNNGVCIKFNKEDKNAGINIFEIESTRLKDESYIERKIKNITQLFNGLSTLTKIEEVKVGKALKNMYTVFKENVIKKIQELESREIFVTYDKNKKIKISLDDFLQEISDRKLKAKLEELFTRFPYLLGTKNIYENNLVIFDFSSNFEKEKNDLMLYALNEVELEISYAKQNNEKVVIVFDEIFKYIQKNSDNELIQKILLLYKTIRKKGASIITVTQDIEDFFLIGNGEYGKIVMNNSAFKFFFKLSYYDASILTSISGINIERIKNIENLSKGKTNLNFLNNNIVIDVLATEEEIKLIER